MAKWHDYKHWNKPKYGRQNKQVVVVKPSSVEPAVDRGPRVKLGKIYERPRAKFERRRTPRFYQKKDRSYRPTPAFSSIISGAVSILLVVALIGTVFVAYSNSTIEKFEDKSYFSPSHYLSGLSSTQSGRYIERKAYEIEIYPAGSLVGTVMYRASVTMRLITPIDDETSFAEPYTIQSENRLSLYQIQRGSRFVFEINGVEFEHFYLVNSETGAEIPAAEPPLIGTIDTNEYWPNVPYIPIQPSRPGQFHDLWKDVDGLTDFFNAIGPSASLIWNDVVYATYVIENLLPWNSVRKYSSLPSDGTKVNIPWRDSNNAIIEGQL